LSNEETVMHINFKDMGYDVKEYKVPESGKFNYWQLSQPQWPT